MAQNGVGSRVISKFNRGTFCNPSYLGKVTFTINFNKMKLSPPGTYLSNFITSNNHYINGLLSKTIINIENDLSKVGS